jgi:hypothetical protein
LAKIYKEKADVLRTTPFGNDILADLAMKAIEKRRKDDATDFLTVSFFSTDMVILLTSFRCQDTYLRLDQNIDQF